MLRALVLLLLLANAAFFAWWQGWLDPVLPPRADHREPERLAAQVRPESITVLNQRAASAALAAASATEREVLLCLEAGPFSEAAATAAETVLVGHSVPDGSVAREPQWSNYTWGVVMGRFPDRDTMRAKAEELKKLAVRYDELTVPPALVPGLRLGNFSDRYGAETALNNLAKKGVRSARVAQLPTGTAQWWLRVARADAEMQTRLKTLPTERLAGGFKPCAAAVPAATPR